MNGQKKPPVGRFLFFRTAQDPMEKSHGASLGTGKTSESSQKNLSLNINSFFNSTSQEKTDSEKFNQSDNLNSGYEWITTPTSSMKNSKKNNGKNPAAEPPPAGINSSSEKNIRFPTHQKRKGNSPQTNEMQVPNKNSKGSSPLSPFLTQIDPKSSSFGSGSLRTENLKVSSTFQGHHSRSGLSCLVIHKFQGIPSQYPRTISSLLDILISQGLMPSVQKQIEEQFFVFWEIENFVLTVGKPE